MVIDTTNWVRIRTTILTALATQGLVKSSVTLRYETHLSAEFGIILMRHLLQHPYYKDEAVECDESEVDC